jgi:hypothetical protein
MANPKIFIAGNLEPILYEELNKKYPEKSDTQLIVEGLNLLLNEKVIKLNLKSEDNFNQVIEKTKNLKRDLGDVASELLFYWIKGKIKVYNEKP